MAEIKVKIDGEYVEWCFPIIPTQWWKQDTDPTQLEERRERIYKKEHFSDERA